MPASQLGRGTAPYPLPQPWPPTGLQQKVPDHSFSRKALSLQKPIPLDQPPSAAISTNAPKVPGDQSLRGPAGSAAHWGTIPRQRESSGPVGGGNRKRILGFLTKEGEALGVHSSELKNLNACEATSDTPRTELLHWALGMHQAFSHPGRH